MSKRHRDKPHEETELLNPVEELKKTLDDMPKIKPEEVWRDRCDDYEILAEEIITEVAKIPDELRPRAFTPRDCTQCTALRPKASDSYSYVYHTRGSVRYCKCKFCGNTWAQSVPLS